jgi:hypothetical protein
MIALTVLRSVARQAIQLVRVMPAANIHLAVGEEVVARLCHAALHV